MKNVVGLFILISCMPFVARAANVDCDSPNIDLSHEPKCKPGELTIVQELAPHGQLRCMGFLRTLVSCPGTDSKTKLIPKDSFSAFIGSQFDDPGIVSALRETNSLKGKETVKDLVEKLNGLAAQGIGIDDNGKISEFKKLQFLRDRYSAWLKSNQSAVGLAKTEFLSSVTAKNQSTISMLKSKECTAPEYNEVLKSGSAIVIRFEDGFEQVILPYDFQYQSGSKFEVSSANGILGHGGLFAKGTASQVENRKAVFSTDANGQVYYKSGEKPAYKITGMRTISLKEASKDSSGRYVDACKIQAVIKASIPTAPTSNSTQPGKLSQ